MTGWRTQVRQQDLPRRSGQRRAGRERRAPHERERRAGRGGFSGGVARIPATSAGLWARRRVGSLGLAMANGRCRMHGGASTAPRTPEGLARIVAAKTTHGRYGMAAAPKRLAQRYVRTLITRIALTDAATQLRAYLPAGMAARLEAAPEELRAPKHPSQVAFDALNARACCDSVPPGLGLGRRARAARARLGADDGLVDGAVAVALRGPATERLATRAETASQAPWRAGDRGGAGAEAGDGRGAAPNAGYVQRPYTRGGGPPNSGSAQRPYTRREGPNSGYAQRPYMRREGPNSGYTQRPYMRREGSNSGYAQRPYMRRGGANSGFAQRPYTRRDGEGSGGGGEGVGGPVGFASGAMRG